jgi:hypothetical protein
VVRSRISTRAAIYDDGWAFSFGDLDENDVFVLNYGVIVNGDGVIVQFDAFEHRREASPYHTLAARALQAVRADFERFREREEFIAAEYRIAVLPFPRGRMTAFVSPAQTDPSVTFLGNDLMYTLSREHVEVNEPTRFHHRLIAIPYDLPHGALPSLIVPHAPIPSPLDVLHAMERGEPLLVAAGQGEYVIQPDGRIGRLDPDDRLAQMLREAAREN